MERLAKQARHEARRIINQYRDGLAETPNYKIDLMAHINTGNPDMTDYEKLTVFHIACEMIGLVSEFYSI